MVVQLGYVISGHGFGHATRAIAVMQAISRKIDAHFTILTSVPGWLFASSLTAPHTVHPMVTDVGLVQHSALIEDLNTTLAALASLYPLKNALIEQAALLLNQCALVLCDIAPLGIAAAKRVGIPSILVENFTWDWIYQGYLERCPELQPQIDYLRVLFQEADFHVQAIPACCPCPCDLQVEPVARSLQAPERIRQRFFCRPDQRLVILTMGGVQTAHQQALDLSALLKSSNTVFVLTGLSREDEFTNNLRFLAQDGPWYFPDLVAAADLVVGKSGYSTVAEAYQGQTAYGYVKRPNFRESAVLEAFLDRSLISWEIVESALADGTWLDQLDRLSATKEIVPRPENGADQIAGFVLQLSQGKPEWRI